MAKSNAPRLDIEISVTGMAKASRDFVGLREQLKQAGDEFKKANFTANEFEAELNSLSKSLSSGKISSASYNKESKFIRDNLASARQAAQGYQRQMLSLGATIEQGSNSGRSYGEEVKRLQGVHNSFASGMRSSNAVAVEFSRIIQDSPYGIQGVANNLQQLTQNYAHYAQSVRTAAAEQGKQVSGFSIVKGALGSLMNPLNLLTIGVSLVTAGWVLFDKQQQKSAKAAKESTDRYDELSKSLNNVSKATVSSSQSYGSEIAKLNTLYAAATDVNISLDARTLAVKNIKKEYPEYFKGLTNEAILAGNAKSVYDELTKSIIATATARGAESRIAEKATQQIILDETNRELQKQVELERKTVEANKAKGKAMLESINSSTENADIIARSADGLMNSAKSEREISNIQKEINKNLQDRARIQEDINQLSKVAVDNQSKLTKQLGGGGGGGGAKGKMQAELIKEANEALKTGQEGTLRGIDNALAKIDAKWDSISAKINKIADSGLRKQQLELSKLGREQEKYNKYLDAFAKSRSKITRNGLPTTTTGVLSVPSAFPGLERAQQRINRPAMAMGLEDEFSKQFKSTLRRGLSSTFNSFFSDLSSMSESNYEIEKKYADLRANATSDQIAGLQKMEVLEKKINNGLTNMLSKIGSTFTGIAGNLLSSALSTGIAEGNFKDLQGMFTGKNKAMGYGALGSLAGSALGGAFKPSDVAGQGLSGALSGAGSGMAIGTAIGGPVGTVIGAVGGALIGGLSSIFGASKRKREEELMRMQLEEQKKIAHATERQAMLTYQSQVIGQMTNQGVVTNVERDALGDLVATIKGSEIELIRQRNKNSRN